MAADELERLRALYERWAEGDFRSGGELFADDVLMTTFDADGDEIELHGIDEFRRWFRGFLEQWQVFRMKLVEMERHENHVLVVADQYAVGQTSGAELAMRVYAVWRFERGRAVEFHTTRHEEVALRRLERDVR